MGEPPRMTRRAERDAAERRRARGYELALGAGAALLGAALLAAFGTVLYAAVMSPPAPPADLLPGLAAAERQGVWTGFLRVPADDRYIFSVVPAGEAQLQIAGRDVLGAGATDLAAGHHPLRLEITGSSGRLYWESRTRPREAIPPQALFHSKR